jgi:iron complex transport system substrate-binding protein
LRIQTQNAARHWVTKLMLNALKFIAACAVFTWTTGVFSQSISVKDDAGNTITLQSSAQRIITLAPNLAELVYSAGAGSTMVAATRYSDYPDAVAQLPLVGDAFALNFERIAALKPDVVFVWLSGTPERQRSTLKTLAARQGFAVFESEIRTISDMGHTLERIGQLAGTQKVASAQAAAMQAQWAALGAQYANAQRVKVFYQVWDAPLMTFNGQHLVSQAIRACGGMQGFDAQTALTPTINREAVLAFNPQTIIGGDESPGALAVWRKLPQIDAVKNAQLHTVNAAVLTRMGPRFVQAATDLCVTIAKAR